VDGHAGALRLRLDDRKDFLEERKRPHGLQTQILGSRELEKPLDHFIQTADLALNHLDVLDGGVVKSYSAFIVQFGIDTVDYFSGWPTKLHGSMPAAPHDMFIA